MRHETHVSYQHNFHTTGINALKS